MLVDDTYLLILLQKKPRTKKNSNAKLRKKAEILLAYNKKKVAEAEAKAPEPELEPEPEPEPVPEPVPAFEDPLGEDSNHPDGGETLSSSNGASGSEILLADEGEKPEGETPAPVPGEKKDIQSSGYGGIYNC